jgi:two-component system nitrate/nitrite sensor histidine kinase NarQ
VVASIRDDGSGFDATSAREGPAGHFGLEIMRERANRFGGVVKVVSSASAGTVVNVVIPYPA